MSNVYVSSTNVKQRDVAIYTRVSTEHEEQMSALENQKDWYKPITEQHPEWNVIRMYVDAGITGTSAQKRPRFMRMIADAEAGEFDLILTREVTRFARNTVDTLQYTRRLKAAGVEVFFINDNIRTFDGDGELRLTIMATLAQDESRKTSIRVKAGQQTSMEKGVYYGNGNILGYDRVGKDLVINPEQARTVRMIYDWYLEGIGIKTIKFKLEELGVLTATGKTRWYETNISKVLSNSFYCGIITYHKQYVPDFLEQKKINNFGEIEQFQVRGTHQPIVTEEEYCEVQRRKEARRAELKNVGYGKHRFVGQKPPQDLWTRLLECECGHRFNRKRWHTNNYGTSYAYQCYSSVRTGTVQTRLNKGLPIEGICQSPMIPEWKLQIMVEHVFNEYITNTDEVLALAESIVAKHLNDPEPEDDTTQLVEAKMAERDKLKKRLNQLVTMRADGEIDKAMFMEQKEKIEGEITTLESSILKLRPQLAEPDEDDLDYENKIAVLRYHMERMVSPKTVQELPQNIIEAFVRKVVVHPNGFDWYLRFNAEKAPRRLQINGKRRNNAVVEELDSDNEAELKIPHLVNCNTGCNQRKKELRYIRAQRFVITQQMARERLYSKNTQRRIFNWFDLVINIYI